MPLSIDKLPMDVLETIKRLRSYHGLSWLEIERLSSLPYSQKWETKLGSAGFVNWDEMPTRVLQHFPGLRLPHSNLHRWYDIQVEQAQREVLARAEQARVIAKEFAAAGIDKADEAVMNAARDVIFGMLQAADDRTRGKASAGLIALAEVMNGARANQIKERKVLTEERRMKLLERDAEMKRKRFEKEMDDAARKVSRGEAITEADINRIRERVFGIGPAAG